MTHFDTVLTDDGSRTVHSTRYGETYHSTFGALTEARHVYLDATGVTERLSKPMPTRVLEIGFGLGLNALLTADLAAANGATLDYHGFEHDLVPDNVFSGLDYASLLSDKRLMQSLENFVRCARKHDSKNLLTPYSHKLSNNVELTLHLKDAAQSALGEVCGTGFHAIYLDAFSPDANAECWSPEFMTRLASVLHPTGKMTTYSAKGTVRRAMLAAGLTVRKLPGPPGKREMLVATVS